MNVVRDTSSISGEDGYDEHIVEIKNSFYNTLVAHQGGGTYYINIGRGLVMACIAI